MTREQDKSARVLLAADDVGSLLRLAALLDSAGYQVEICNDGPHAAAMARVCQPDLVALCATATPWDVFATGRAIKSDAALAWLPLLIISDSRLQLPPQTQEGEFADDLLSAPFTDRDFLGHLQRLLRLGQERGQLQRLQAELAALGRMSATVRSLPRQDHLLRTALHTVLEVIGIESGAVFLFRPEWNALELTASSGVSKELVRLLARVSCPADFASLAESQAVVILPVSADPDDAENSFTPQPCIYRPALLNEGYAVYGYVPLAAGDQVMGLIAFASRQSRLFSEWDAHLLTAIGHQVGQTLESAQLYGAVRESEERYRVLTEEAPVGIFIVRDGDLIYTNRRFQEAWPGGAPTNVAELIGLVPVSERAQVLRQALLQPEGQTLDPLEFEALGPRGGQNRWFVLRIAPVRYAGQPARLGTLLDITEQKRIEQALLRTEKLHTLGQMAGGIAHNFNNILAGIQGYLDFAKRDMGDAAMLRHDLAQIELGARDAAQAVRRLQSLYRPIEDTSDFVPLSLNDLVTEVLALTQPRWRDEQQRLGRTIEVKTALGNVPTISGNPGELREVLTNLVLNAVEAMPAGGVIAIETRSEREHVLLTLHDSGVGMTTEQIGKIWEPFYTTKGASGSGLGLAISQRIVERHGGEFSVASAPGQGSAFTIKLPITQVEEVVAAPTLERNVPAGRRVLVVDDEPVVTDILERILTQAGEEVTVANSGRNAMAALEEGRFSLLITDLGMPDISGVAVSKRAHKLYPDMPVILSTGWGATITPEQVSEMGASQLLAKPFTLEQLQELLATYLQ